MSDGEVVFNTKLDNKQLEKDLAKLSKQIASKEQKLAQNDSDYSASIKHWRMLADQSNEARINLKSVRDEQAAIQEAMANGSAEDYMAAFERKDKIDAGVKKAESLVAELQKPFDEATRKMTKLGEEGDHLRNEISEMKEHAGELVERISKAAESQKIQAQAAEKAADATARASEVLPEIPNRANTMSEAMARAETYMQKFSARVKGLAKRALVFSVIAAGLRHLKDWLWNVIQTDNEATAAMAQLKGALLTMVQPLMSVVIPAFTMLVRVLTSVISTIAQLIALLTGKSFSGMKQGAKAANQQAKAIKGVGSAAKEASKYLAGFDELNVMSDSSSDSGGGGGAIETPDFDFGAEKSEEQLWNILGLIELVAAGLLGWKFGNGFLDGVKKALGFFLIINGAIRLITEYFDAWQNGISFDSLNVMLGSLLEIVLGLYLAFGPTAAAIGLIAGGLALVVLGIQDIIKNGFTLENLITTISGILLASVGIVALTGSWIPLLIGAIASLLLVIVNFFGDTDQLVGGLREILDGFKDFFSGIFSGDIDKTCGGISKMIHGLQDVLFSVIDALKNMLFSFLDWLDEKTGGKLHGIIEMIKGLFSGAFGFIKDALGSVLSGITQMLNGLIKFLSGVFTGNWSQAWEGIKDIVAGAWDAVAGIIEAGVNAIIRGINWLTQQMNKISFSVPSWVPGIGGRSIGINIPTISEVQIPRLATGTVIPPNQEFLAVLGDQKHGTNIEAPLDTIKQAVAEVASPAQVLELLAQISLCFWHRSGMEMVKLICANCPV